MSGVTKEGMDMVREAAKEAANEALERYSAQVDLKFARSEQALMDSINQSIDQAFEKYLGMSATEHAIAHAEAARAIRLVEEVRSEVRRWFLRAIFSGAVLTAAVGGYSTVRADDYQLDPVVIREEYEQPEAHTEFRIK